MVYGLGFPSAGRSTGAVCRLALARAFSFKSALCMLVAISSLKLGLISNWMLPRQPDSCHPIRM